MGQLRVTSSPLMTSSGNSGLLVFTRTLTGFAGTLALIDTGISQILYIDVLNLITAKSVDIEINVTGFSTVDYVSNVDLTNHQIIIKGV